MPLRDTTSSAYVDHIYALAGWDPSDPPGPGDLLLRLLGPTCAKSDHVRADSLDARLFFRDNEWRVLVPSNLTGAPLSRALARVLARWYALTHLSEESTTPDIELIANEIMLPSRAIAVAVNQFGNDAEAIASWLSIPYDVVADKLRYSGTKHTSGLYVRVVGTARTS